MTDPMHFNPVPLFAQLKTQLRERILDGTYAPSSRLPSEHQLCALHGVSRITVRQALGDLQKEGLIFKVPGKGTFVSRPKAFQNVSTLQGLGEAVQALGHEVINQVRSLRLIDAQGAVAERLKLKPGAAVLQVKRVRLIDRVPVSLEITYLPASLAELMGRADLASRDIFLILENDAGIALGHADLAVDAILADPELASALGAEEGSPVMRIERLTHDAEGQPLDYEHLYYRGDAFQYRLRIDRHKGPAQ
ncbi:GntR family transcriptional regulator [Pseudomonas sp. KNUC1026]|uniref:GntR family transcriptional regulator n=1 Tax=Pseudomonas sp. KNUC1026 TaxID=2893890 RepID=UPI001F1A8A62|nr:GntR family transcriptional regulator [Pseudomonas sp. KNUC1026]UFH51085.1 GntR family transcriptional regulator [Pseudomonas sp. KNUC1026]